MNNKETLQSHNDKLHLNNTNLNTILEAVNTLPDIDNEEKYVFKHARFAYYGGTELTEELNSLDLASVTTVKSMFYHCYNLTELDLSGLDTSNVTDMSYMFSRCENLTELDLSGFDTSNVTNMYYMFQGCTKLTKLDIRNFTFTKVMTYSNMFDSVPTNCLIIVKDGTAKSWITSKFSFTNIKTVAELEG